jgi:hypothetical protein
VGLVVVETAMIDWILEIMIGGVLVALCGGLFIKDWAACVLGDLKRAERQRQESIEDRVADLEDEIELLRERMGQDA